MRRNNWLEIFSESAERSPEKVFLNSCDPEFNRAVFQFYSHNYFELSLVCVCSSTHTHTYVHVCALLFPYRLNDFVWYLFPFLRSVRVCASLRIVLSIVYLVVFACASVYVFEKCLSVFSHRFREWIVTKAPCTPLSLRVPWTIRKMVIMHVLKCS